MQLPQRLARFNRHVTNPTCRHGKTFGVADPQTVTKEQAARHVPGAPRRVLARLPWTQAVRLTKTG